MEEHQKSQSVVHIEVEDEVQSAVLETTRERKKSFTKRQKLLRLIKNCNLTLKEARKRETTTTEKMIWLLMFTSCFLYCGLLIWKSYSKWIRSPAIVILTANDEPIRQIPFPAVTVCPERKVLSKEFNFTSFLSEYFISENETGEIEVKYMYEDLSLICNYYEMTTGRNFSFGNDTVKNIFQASVTLSDVLHECKWKGEDETCDNLLTPLLTEEGVCFTFNTIGPEDLFHLNNMHTDYEYMAKLNRTRNQGWSMENGYPSDASRDTYPFRGSGAGSKIGLVLTVRESNEGLDSDCNEKLSGFKILLHNPSDLPRPSQQYIRIPTFEHITISFTASLEFTSDGLEVFTPEGRQCFFEDERSLHYFKMYSQSNCEYECLVNFTYARCGCVHFSMPHGPNVPICSNSKIDCMVKAESELATTDIEEKYKGNTTAEDIIRIANHCNCLPACTSITYETEVTQTKLSEYHKIGHTYSILFFKNGTLNEFKERSSFQLTTIEIFFKRPLFDVSKRSEMYGISDILANCGGLLGLFMGFSVINIIEILYFCILSVYRRQKADKFSHTNEQPVQHSKDKMY